MKQHIYQIPNKYVCVEIMGILRFQFAGLNFACYNQVKMHKLLRTRQMSPTITPFLATLVKGVNVNCAI